MIDEESPAEISSTEAPSFCACFTDEFMNTVHLEPSSTGAFANSPRHGERLDERAAAGGTSLIQHDAVDAVVLDLKALDILSADVDDKINVRAEISRRLIVRNSFNYTIVNAQTCLYKILTVACYRRSLYVKLRGSKAVDLLKL